MLAGVYIFFTLFCGVQIPENPYHDAAFYIEMPTQLAARMGVNEACYIGRDSGFPPSWSGLPGAETFYRDSSFKLVRRVNPAMVRSENT